LSADSALAPVGAPEARAVPLAQFGERWRLLPLAAADGPTNMAVDALLLERARTSGEAVLRLYSWSAPTLSLGRHERTRGRFDPLRLRAAGVDAVRRRTGGRALLHDHELTYSVTAPAGSSPLRSRYAAINHLLADALRVLGVRADVTPDHIPTAKPGSAACFAEPNAGELVVGGRKLVASAQVEEDGAFLQHGSILLHDDQSRIADLCDDEDFPPTQATALTSVLGREVAAAEVAAALVSALTEDLAHARVTLEPFGQSLSDVALAGARARFLDPAWTWRR
jgi:lipoate-protein ligase A